MGPNSAMTLPAGSSSNSLAGLSMGGPLSGPMGTGSGLNNNSNSARSLRLERVAQALAHSSEELRRLVTSLTVYQIIK